MKYLISILLTLYFIFDVFAFEPDIARKELERRKIGYNFTEFMDHLKKEDIETVSLFLNAGIDINRKIGPLITPLMIAAKEGHVEILELLISHGAKLDDMDATGRTALRLSCQANNLEVAKVLIESGADMTIRDDQDQNALNDAILFENLDIVNLLLSKGLNLDDRNMGEGYSGKTALMYAIDKGNINIINTLLNYGANVNIKTKNGNTALMIAEKKGDQEIINLLLKAGAKETSQNNVISEDNKIFLEKGEYILDNGRHHSSAILTVKASSTLKSYKDVNYNANNVHDYKTHTAWIEGKYDYGVEEYLEFKFDFSTLKTTKYYINTIIVNNGYSKTKELWKANSRVKELEISLNDQFHTSVTLEDVQKMQVLKIPKIQFEAQKIYKIKCKILDVYMGTKYKDTAISELVFVGGPGE